MEEREALARTWPLFGLEVRTPRLSLRLPDDTDALALADRADDVHPRDFMPFLQPWTRARGDELRHGVLQFLWRERGAWSPDGWSLPLAVVVDGQVLGIQHVSAQGFAVRRTVETGSWLHRPAQGRGIGTEMRAAVLHLAFAGLGAERAESGSLDGNDVSAAVSRRLGYRDDGEAVHVVEDRRRVEQRFVLDREAWSSRRRDDIELLGLDPCLPLFGAP